MTPPPPPFFGPLGLGPESRAWNQLNTYIRFNFNVVHNMLALLLLDL